MSLEPVTFARHVGTEGRIFFSLVRKVVVLTEELTAAAATIEKHNRDISDLKEAVRALQTANELQAARLESIAVRAAADITGELSRRLGFLEGRASRT